MILTTSESANALFLWLLHCDSMAENILNSHQQELSNNGIQVTDHMYNECLCQIQTRSSSWVVKNLTCKDCQCRTQAHITKCFWNISDRLTMIKMNRRPFCCETAIAHSWPVLHLHHIHILGWGCPRRNGLCWYTSWNRQDLSYEPHFIHCSITWTYRPCYSIQWHCCNIAYRWMHIQFNFQNSTQCHYSGNTHVCN